jgi:hypothetical protein
MPVEGSFSYETDSERVIGLNQQFKAKLVRLDQGIASLRFLNANELELAAIPPGFSLKHTSSGADAARMENAFIVSWAASYELLYNGQEVMQLHNERQQAIHGLLDSSIINLNYIAAAVAVLYIL